MIAASFRAMGTSVQVTVARPEDIAATQALFEEVERRCSRFRPSSELSNLNNADAADLLVSEPMAEVLQIAADLRDRTDGLVDAGLGAAVSAWGYDRSFDIIDETSTPAPIKSQPVWSMSGNCLHRSPGTRIDLGGVAKGWACDQAVESGLAVIVNAGGDVRSRSSEAQVDIIDPWGHRVARVPLGVGALATSSTTRRRWKIPGGEAHHLIDPRTLAPAVSPIVSATAVAATTVEAEAGAKAMLLHGSDGLAWAAAQPWIKGALAVWEEGSVYATNGLQLVAA